MTPEPCTTQAEDPQATIARLERELEKARYMERMAHRYALKADKECTEAEATVKERDAVIARLRAHEARIELELHDVKTEAQRYREALETIAERTGHLDDAYTCPAIGADRHDWCDACIAREALPAPVADEGSAR